jgi:hypothetical protein
MNADHLDAEREIDLARWRRALTALCWLPAAGLVLGVIVGFLFTVGGTTSYKATVLISLGQPVSPGGVLIASYATNPRAISEITSSASAQDQAAHEVGIHPGVLRGKVSVGVVGVATGVGAAKTAPLIALSVQGKISKKTEDANALARIVVADTTAPYVGTKIATYESVLQTAKKQLASINLRLSALQTAIAKSHLDPAQPTGAREPGRQRRAAAGEPPRSGGDHAAAARLRQQRRERQDCSAAASVLASAHSRRTSLVIGALIGLILGGIAAIAGYGRIGRLTRA